MIEQFEKIYDIQRLSTRMSNGSANPKDFLSLKESLYRLPELVKLARDLDFNPFSGIEEYMPEIMDYTNLIERTIDENAPIVIKDGGIIKEGVSGELDYFRELLTGGENWLKTFEEQEKERTGIKSLRVNYNKVFGYYIEISKSYLNQVPPEYNKKTDTYNR